MGFIRRKAINISTSTQIGGYTVPVGYTATIIGFTITAKGGARIVSAFLRGGGDSYLVENADIPLGGALVLAGGDQKIVLAAGDSVYVVPNGNVDVYLSMLEVAD